MDLSVQLFHAPVEAGTHCRGQREDHADAVQRTAQGRLKWLMGWIATGHMLVHLAGTLKKSFLRHSLDIQCIDDSRRMKNSVSKRSYAECWFEAKHAEDRRAPKRALGTLDQLILAWMQLHLHAYP